MKAKQTAPHIKDLRLFDTCVTLGQAAERRWARASQRAKHLALPRSEPRGYILSP
ncbi:MAG: hypothetical protein HQ592_04395, partial [Planctomycetes bacterium]|nr:hypothetical protein [Planctomycetota bacterium]